MDCYEVKNKIELRTNPKLVMWASILANLSTHFNSRLFNSSQKFILQLQSASSVVQNLIQKN